MRSAVTRCGYYILVSVASLQTAIVCDLTNSLPHLMQAAQRVVGFPPQHAKVGRARGPGFAAFLIVATLQTVL